MMKMMLLLGATVLAAPLAAQTGRPVAVAQPVPAAADPARLAEGRIVIAKLLPPGIYRTLMGSTMAPMMDSMGDSLKALPLRQLATMGGLDAKQAAALDKVNIEQVMAIYDPHWRERSQLTMRAMFDQMGDFFTTLEPELREAYAHAYADRFTLAELRDLNAFFLTPTGMKYAAGYMTVASDPAIVAEMRAMVPKLMQQMPAFLAAGKKATAGLPPERKLADLDQAQRAALAKALGVPESQLHDPKAVP